MFDTNQEPLGYRPMPNRRVPVSLPVFAIMHPTLGEVGKVTALDADAAARAATAAYGWLLPAGALTAQEDRLRHARRMLALPA